MTRKLHFVAVMDEGYALAICLEHDLVTQCDSMDGIRAECERMIRVTVACDREEGNNPWTRPPPPDDAVEEFRDLPGWFEFELEFDDAAPEVS